MKLTPSTTHRILTIPQAALLQCAMRLGLMQPTAIAPKNDSQLKLK